MVGEFFVETLVSDLLDNKRTNNKGTHSVAWALQAAATGSSSKPVALNLDGAQTLVLLTALSTPVLDTSHGASGQRDPPHQRPARGA